MFVDKKVGKPHNAADALRACLLVEEAVLLIVDDGTVE